jgi:hypothetical protein
MDQSQCPPAKKQRIAMPYAGSLRPKQLFGKNLPLPDQDAFPNEDRHPVSSISGLNLANATDAQAARYPAAQSYWIGVRCPTNIA